MTEEECVANGGHCFERTGITYPMVPAMYQEICKHCEKERKAVPQPPFRYIYPEDALQ